MIDFTNVIDIMLGNQQVTQIEDSLGNVLWSAAPAITGYFYVEDVSGSDNTLSILKEDANAPTIEVFKSTDERNWTSMGSTDTTAITATVPANGKLYLKATADRWGINNDGYQHNHIRCSANFNVGGNITSLLFADNFATTNTTNTNAYAFNFLLKNSMVVSAANLLFPDYAPKRFIQGLFKDCTRLTTPPVSMQSTTVVNNAYRWTFQNCSSLTTAPVLPATNLITSSYGSMFEGCTSLTTAPALPATTLSEWCYTNMFNGCTALTQAPALPATTLASQCYSKMFKGCTALTQAPALPATTLANTCYANMFQGCTRLKRITTYADDISATDCILGWLDNVAATGDFCNLGSATYTSGGSGIPSGWTEYTSILGYFYVEDASGSDNTLSIVKDGNAYSVTVYKSIDQQNWELLGTTSTTPLTATVPANGKLYLKGSGIWCNLRYNILNSNKISCSAYYKVGGNLISLSHYTDLYKPLTIDYAFAYLFTGNRLIDASNLILPSNVTKQCYQGMFNSSINLTAAPVLPATTLANGCYQYMFSNCTSLNSVTTYANDISASNCLTNWLSGVAATGDFYNLGSATYTVDSPNGIPQGWTEHNSL